MFLLGPQNNETPSYYEVLETGNAERAPALGFVIRLAMAVIAPKAAARCRSSAIWIAAVAGRDRDLKELQTEI